MKVYKSKGNYFSSLKRLINWLIIFRKDKWLYFKAIIQKINTFKFIKKDSYLKFLFSQNFLFSFMKLTKFLKTNFRFVSRFIFKSCLANCNYFRLDFISGSKRLFFIIFQLDDFLLVYFVLLIYYCISYFLV